MLFPQPGKIVIFSGLTNMQDFQTKKLLKLAQAVRNDNAVQYRYRNLRGRESYNDSSAKIQRMHIFVELKL
jgi:hypothetical protein